MLKFTAKLLENHLDCMLWLLFVVFKGERYHTFHHFQVYMCVSVIAIEM